MTQMVCSDQQVVVRGAAREQSRGWLVAIPAVLVYSRAVEDLVVRYLSAVPEVAAVYMHRDEDFVHVWTLLTDAGRTARMRVYAQEAKILDELPGATFDFLTVMHGGEPDQRPSTFRPIFERR